MTDVLEDAGAEPTLAQRPVSGENSPKRTVLYARKGPGSTQRRAGRRELAVPNWFDLPVLLPESHPVAARIQRNMVSRLGSREEEEERKVRKMGALVLKNTTRRRHSTRIRKLDGLGHVDRRKRLREKVWKDLSRFGLWPMAGPGDFNDQQSVEKTVDAIWSQWQDNAEKIPLSGWYLFDGRAFEEESSSFGFSATRLQAKVQTPGLKRRKRLTDLHHFVETQLQKRLFRSWDTIEIAFTGSGDMTVNQIVKFLQLSDVQLGNNDAAKVQKILEEHEHLIRGRTKSKAVLSFEGFRQIFHPVDPLEASRWKREFDREKFRQRQEKDIYTRELEALEEKVRQRLATSAKHMIDVLQQFKCDRKDIPWENEQQRQHMRSQFLDVIFRKPQRRRILQHDTRLQHSDLTQTPEAQTTNSAPLKLSIKVILSTLLQKFSRNGHFESVEVPAAAYLYHDLAADIIKQSIRRYWEQFEIDQWPERQIIFRFRMKKQIFYDWRAFAERSRLLCKYVLRKFVAWKYMTRKLHEHYAFYRISFWPFYVWKRHLQQMIIARGKTEFLMNVLRTYIQLRNFRALKLRYKTKQWNKKQITRMRNKKLKKIRRICWATWKDRFQRSRLIRQIWKNHGNTLQQLHKFYMVRVTFYILRYYSILKRDMKQRKYMSLLGQFSATARAKALAHQHQRHHKGTVNHDRAAQQRGSFYPTDNEPSKVSATRRSLPMTTYEPPQHGRGSTAGVRNTRGSLTRIMETELGKKIKRKSRLYDLCLGMYLKYRERDRINMIGNVIAYRRFGRIFVKYLRTTVHQGKINRFATDLGAFHVLSSRFRQWMIGTVYKLPPATQDGVEPVKKDDEAEETGEKVVLHWREDREWRLLAIANNPVRALQLRQDLLSTMESDAVRKETIRGREQLLTKKQANEDAFLRLETSATLKIKAAQMQQVQQIMRRRAHRLHDAMDNVYDVLLQQQARQQLKSSFRSLRVVVMMKYTSMLCHCAQIRNWLRLCHRFMYWERNMGVFYKQKLKYHAFQTLLKHAVWKWKFQSPRLSQKLQRSQKLMWKYENYMQEQDLFDGSSESLRLAGTRNSPANSFRSIFLRWIQFAQCSKARETIVKLSRRKREIWSMHTVFHALKNRVKVKYTYAERCALLPYLWRQCMVDLDTYHCKIIALEQRLPSSHLRAQLTHTRKLMRETAISSPTLKKLFQDHENEVRLRLQLEKRLMLAAYSERAVHKHAERSSSLFGTTAGKPFTHDKVPPFGSISEVGIICGKKVDGICVVLKASGQANIEGSIHGNPFGTHEVFSLGRGEKLVSIEGFASQSIYGLRFGTSVGRYSKWFGHCEKGSKFEVHSDFFSNREEIVGFFGHADNASINSLGVVMRHTTIKNPFEGLWVLKDNHTQHNMLQQSPHRGSVDELPLSDRQFAYFLQVRACEVLMIMERAHLFAIRAYKIEDTLPPALGNMRIIMAMARWMLNALSHGLVQRTEREEEGKQILISGQEKYAVGEKLLSDGTNTMQIVDGFRDSAGQLDAATLGVKKIIELKDKMTQAQQQMVQGERLRDEGQHEIMRSQRFLPHLPTTKRMISAIRTMYKVVQTKDEIDHMNPELRSFLLLKKSGRSEGEAL
ncbi:uncharacterized protein PITG_17246 [Phytophthora infestans T30-4]|uniref:Jacalin-type lectin domain-containing protein n=1 Tax=Phytophthora infestans (strain T30-4) TaxID=403677 RepID=D0NVL5_PHYIT|nr:uncharacterized protein PITG_17246 [Phytophthora infestans T30-4]EEY66696.1 conserved hypothetical protein [Phytophthora infestans T30-4]|eukprot:XP_002896761.1 conserved hypothetical protein [Phytophthora infestans T30-4]